MTTYRSGVPRPDLCSDSYDWRHDVAWTSTAFGEVARWPVSLQTAASLLFSARHPMLLFWGPDYLCVMNPAACRLRGGGPLVAPADVAWPESWRRLRHYVQSVMAGAPAIWHDDWPLPIRGPRGDADICFTLTCSPVPDPAAPSGIGGALVLFVESTPAVLAPRAADGMAEEALHQAQKMEALGQLTGGVAHDFNNLLGAMIGSFELIRRRYDDPPRVRKLAEAGLLTAERGAKLTSQLLTFSRAQQMALTPISVGATLEGIGDMLRRTLGPQIAVTFDVGCGGRFVLSDRTQLEMAVLNLAINSRDAMPEGGQLTASTRVRRIESESGLAAGDHVELVIRDTGVGMSPDVAARAFDPFFTTKGVGKGTGLGLSQVEGIARQAGGAVWIESEPGCGTTVRMLLPCTEGRPTDDEVEAPPERRAASGAVVLLVDDDQDLRAVLAESLQDLGYRVLEAMDGASGLATLEAHEVDVLVADFAMPGMTGGELARLARLSHPALPIICASGYEALALDEAAGARVRVLRKPFRIRELQAEIEAALRSRTRTAP